MRKPVLKMRAVADRKRTCTVFSRNYFAYSYKIVVSRAALNENNRVDESIVGMEFINKEDKHTV